MCFRGGLTVIGNCMLFMQSDARARRQALFRAWMPIGKTILNMVVRAIPSPQEAQASRMTVLARDVAAAPDDSLCSDMRAVKAAMASCATATDACVVFVSKMFAVPAGSVPGAVIAGTDAAAEVFVAFSRVLCGVLRPDTPLYVVGPKYSPRYGTILSIAHPGPPGTELSSGLVLDMDSPHLTKLDTSLALYIMMGRDLLPMTEAAAGMVLGIVNLAPYVMKTATLCSTPACPSLSSLRFQVRAKSNRAAEPSLWQLLI